MTPGERFKNWAEGSKVMLSAIVLLIGALGYTNKDEISGMIFTSDGQKITQLTAFEKYANERLDQIDTARGFDKAELREEIEALSKQLKSQDTTNYRALAKKIQAMEKRMLENHGEN